MRPGTKKLVWSLVVFLSAWLILRLFFPLFSPFFLGFLLAFAADPMVNFLQKRLHLPRPVSTGIGVSMTFSFLAMTLLILCAFLVRELRTLAGFLPSLEQATASGFSLIRSWMLDLATHIPQSIRPMVETNVTALFSDGAALVDKGTGYLLGLAGNLLSHVPDSALSLGTAIISAFLISVKLPRMKRWLLRRIPKERLDAMRITAKRIRTVFTRWLTAQFRLMGVTFLILFLGFVILKIPYALFWALGICLVDAFPVLGTGTILLPWSLVCFLQSDSPRAIGILGIYVTVTLTRSILEPKLLGRHLGLDPLVTLMTLYAGYKLWGLPGMFLAPILTVTALQILPNRT